MIVLCRLGCVDWVGQGRVFRKVFVRCAMFCFVNLRWVRVMCTRHGINHAHPSPIDQVSYYCLLACLLAVSGTLLAFLDGWPRTSSTMPPPVEPLTK